MTERAADTTNLLSVVIVTYNSAVELARLVPDLLVEGDKAGVEVVVVDNASSDASVQVANSVGAHRVLEMDRNFGFAYAVNRGVEASTGSWICLLNPDSYPTLEDLWDLVAALSVDELLAAVTPVTPHVGQEVPPSVDAIEYIAAAPASCLMIRRAALREIGPLDEEIFLYGEDFEWCVRAWRSGWRIGCALSCQVRHDRGGSSQGKRWHSEVTKNLIYAHLVGADSRSCAAFLARQAVWSGLVATLVRGSGQGRAWIGGVAKMRRALAKRGALAQREGLSEEQMQMMLSLYRFRRLREQNRYLPVLRSLAP